MSRKGAGDGSNDKGHMRIVFVELHGSDASLHEGLRTLAAAIGRPVQTRAPQPNVPGLPVNAAEAILITDADAPGSAESPPVDTLVPAGFENDDKPRRRGDGKKRDRNSDLELVGDLNFRPTGKLSLKDFSQGKAPETDQERCLVFLYYLKHVMELSAVGPSHVFTCYKEAGLRSPADVKQTIRNIQAEKAWLSFTDIGDIRVTVGGQNYVEHDLPRQSRK